MGVRLTLVRATSALNLLSKRPRGRMTSRTSEGSSALGGSREGGEEGQSCSGGKAKRRSPWGLKSDGVGNALKNSEMQKCLVSHEDTLLIRTQHDSSLQGSWA